MDNFDHISTYFDDMPLPNMKVEVLIWDVWVETEYEAKIRVTSKPEDTGKDNIRITYTKSDF